MTDIVYDITIPSLKETIGDIAEESADDTSLTRALTDIAHHLDDGIGVIESAARRVDLLKKDDTFSDSYRKSLIDKQLQAAQDAAANLPVNVSNVVESWRQQTEKAAKLPMPEGDNVNVTMAIELKRQAIAKRLDACEENLLPQKVDEIIREMQDENDTIGTYALAGGNFLKSYLDGRGEKGRLWTDEVINAVNGAIAPYLPIDVAKARQLLAKHNGTGRNTLNNVLGNASWYALRRLDEIQKAVE